MHYATGGLDRQVFVSRYLIALPSEEQLAGWLRQEQEVLSRAVGQGKNPRAVEESGD